MRVADIVAAAERAAEELRATAERRALERIAEAERAAAMRVQAADDEALQVRSEARTEAEQLRDEAASEAGALRDEAARIALQARDRAAASVREQLAQARAAAREVLHDGEEISGHLRELGDALRVNAERLLLDVRLTHAELTSRLERVDPEAWNGAEPADAPTPATAPVERPPELDVTEFVPSPRARRRR
jgi:vacuolar-type H+-ATPase subunit H